MEETVEKIARELRKLEKVVAANNDHGMPNSAHRFEDVVCNLLNCLYDWELKNLNDEKRNFPFVDLYDEKRKKVVQVTTRKKESIKNKIKQTFDNVRKIYPDSEVYFYSMFGYPDYLDPVSMGVDGTKLLSDETIVTELRNSSDAKKLTAILSVLQQLLNNNKELSLVQDSLFNADMSTEYSIVQYHYLSAFAHGLGRVRVTAYVPFTTESEFSVLFEFGKHSMVDAFISFSEEEAVSSLFDSDGIDLRDRPFIVQVLEEDRVTVQLGNVRLYLDWDTANQLCELVDEVRDIYLKNKSFVAGIIGAEVAELPTIYKPRVFLCRIPNSVWETIKKAEDESIKDINSKYRDRIISNWSHNILQLSNDAGHSLACCIERSGIVDSSECDIFWTPGYVYSGTIEENYANGKLMKVNEARQWLLDEFMQAKEGNQKPTKNVRILQWLKSKAKKK